jgi:hypothetical protein
MVSSLSPPGRSLLDYSLVTCFSLILLLLGILIFDPFNETSIDSTSRSHPSSLVAWDNAAAGDGSNTILDHQQEIDAAAVTSNSELIEVEKQIHDAKAILSEKQDEVEKIVDKVEDEIKDDTSGKVVDGNNNKVETAEEKQHEEEIKEKVIEAVVEKELGLDNWCANCKFRGMPFTCANRVDWVMNKYKITYDVAKESTMEYCTKGGGQARRMLLRRDKSL